MAFVVELKDTARRRQERHNFALAVFDQQHAARLEELEGEIDRLNLAIDGALWEDAQQLEANRRTAASAGDGPRAAQLLTPAVRAARTKKASEAAAAAVPASLDSTSHPSVTGGYAPNH